MSSESEITERFIMGGRISIVFGAAVVERWSMHCKLGMKQVGSRPTRTMWGFRN